MFVQLCVCVCACVCVCVCVCACVCVCGGVQGVAGNVWDQMGDMEAVGVDDLSSSDILIIA